MKDWIGIEEMVAIVDAGSFAGAARALGTSTSQVSRAIAHIEARLQAELFRRTTRSVALTDVGEALLESFRRLVVERDEALAWASGDGEPKGKLRISCAAALGERFVAPIIRRFVELYPAVSVSLNLSNRLVDIIGEGYDVAIRTGHLGDPRLTGVRLGSRKLILCASREYIERRGAPRTIADLDAHECLLGSTRVWRFRRDGIDVSCRPSARWCCNSGAAVLDAVIAGMGIAQLPDFYLRDANAANLVELFPDSRIADEPIWAAYPGRRHITPKLARLIALLETEFGPAFSGERPNRQA